jgi:hypothetical protein
MVSIAINSNLKYANTFKTCLFSLLTATTVGLIATPSYAQNTATVDQSSNQSATQVGAYNTAVQGSVQTGIVSQDGYGYPYGFGYGSNAATLNQANTQDVSQYGIGNNAVQGSIQQGGISQQSSSPYFPGPIYFAH